MIQRAKRLKMRKNKEADASKVEMPFRVTFADDIVPLEEIERQVDNQFRQMYILKPDDK